MSYHWKPTLVVIAILLLGAAPSEATRPLVVDDADPVDPGMVQLESGVSYARDSTYKHWDFPVGIIYGVVPDFEVNMAFSGQIHREESVAGAEHANGIGDLEVGAKWRFLDSSTMGARHALVPSVKLPTASRDDGLGSGETDYDLTWVVSWAVDEATGINVNLGYTWLGGVKNDAVHYGVGVEYMLVDSLQWVGEVFAEQIDAHNFNPDVACNTGLRWTAMDGLALDAAAGTRIHGDAPEVALTVGLTYLFGLN